MRLVCGVGFNDGTRPAVIDGKRTKEYSLWNAMLRRCYSKKSQEKSPTYSSCTVSENFKSYSYFYDWCQNQIGFGFDGYQLDKDLINKGNKVYSEDVCVFVPSHLNAILLNVKSRRGDFPIGITFCKRKKLYQARVQTLEGRVYCGRRKNINDAFLLYKEEKEKYIRTIAEKYRMDVDSRVYNSLMQYTVSIDD